MPFLCAYYTGSLNYQHMRKPFRNTNQVPTDGDLIMTASKNKLRVIDRGECYTVMLPVLPGTLRFCNVEVIHKNEVIQHGSLAGALESKRARYIGYNKPLFDNAIDRTSRMISLLV